MKKRKYRTKPVTFPKGMLFLRRMRPGEFTNAPNGGYATYNEKGEAVAGYENLNQVRGVTRMSGQEVQWMH